MPVPSVQNILEFEKDLWQQGYRYVAGMDEAGRGPLAGPVVSACVIFPPSVVIEGVYDSKALTPSKRNELYNAIMEKCSCYGIGIADNETIDNINILESTKISMQKALLDMNLKPDYLLVDAVKLKTDFPNLPVIHGDMKSFTIAAASIIAKVTRDGIMNRLHEEYPIYNWKENKGYGTESHRRAIHEYGLSPYHRKSFKLK